MSLQLPIPAAQDDCCLDYANTLSWRGSDEPAEALGGFADLLRWLAGRAGLPPEVIAAASGWADAEPAKAAGVFTEAIAVRETIYRAFSGVASGTPVADDDLAALNHALADAPLRLKLMRAPGRYAWAGETATRSAPGLLAPVLWSAADLLTRLDRLRIRRCANDECMWLFVDRSKGGTRRWCDMKSCGNRAKSRRHYLRGKPG